MTAAVHWRLWPRRILALPIRGYRFFLSPWLGSACRFEPTCSRYGFHAVQRHGSVRGSLLTGLRLLRCSPLSNGGFDPVPSPVRRCPPVHSHTSSPGEGSA